MSEKEKQAELKKYNNVIGELEKKMDKAKIEYEKIVLSADTETSNNDEDEDTTTTPEDEEDETSEDGRHVNPEDINNDVVANPDKVDPEDTYTNNGNPDTKEPEGPATQDDRNDPNYGVVDPVNPDLIDPLKTGNSGNGTAPNSGAQPDKTFDQYNNDKNEETAANNGLTPPSKPKPNTGFTGDTGGTIRIYMPGFGYVNVGRNGSINGFNPSGGSFGGWSIWRRVIWWWPLRWWLWRRFIWWWSQRWRFLCASSYRPRWRRRRVSQFIGFFCKL
ncbi:hypothetical protein DC094_14005 [Pelagibaculum spongiae]|uniref:Uncharacterized protein n=1 Tax=Pelagibaculum spongiae TaxID=2080658 RepID=A0A2V1GWR6_9GAMM|nr:hypothetical protein DC094_14005 [Pelagibaculum spongiae]